jgi:hypothetical protein
MITEDYVSFETAKLLKEKGMDISCFNHYVQKNNNDGTSEAVTVCTLQMAMKWLRIEHNIHIESFCPVVDTTDEPVKYNVVISDLRNYCLAFDTPLEDKEFDSYEKACEAAIKYCLENLI